MDIKIIVAAHRRCEMPPDGVYLPVQVGKALRPAPVPGWQGDDEGENISAKNPYYSELTAVYWAWKNLKADYVGLAHYRRYLGTGTGGDKWANILSGEEAARLCGENDIVLPRCRRYYVETLWSHYGHTHDISHLEKTRLVIRQACPEYLPSFEKVMKRTWGHMFNMFLMRKELADAYCAWLFDILFRLESRIDPLPLSPFEARLFGRVSEFLLDVWIDKNGYGYKEIGYVYFGGSNMHRKVWGFLMAALFHRRYRRSF